MISGLPDRPVSFLEVEKLNRSDAIEAVFPATPESIVDSERNKIHIYDLLLTAGETISAVVYTENNGWTVIGKIDADSPKREALEEIIEFRGYDITDEEALESVVEMYDMVEELSA